MVRILLNAYQHDHVYDCPEIIKQYTDEYTDNNSGFAQFKELFLERGAETDYCDLNSIRATWNSLKSGRWGEYDICDQNMPKILEMKEGFPTVLRTNYEPRKKVQGFNVRSVFTGWKMRTEPSMPSNNEDVDDIHFVDETD
ncbi:hypothetical protein ABBQ38_006338 [Trebouxia sp. C0009 RCD-2024]